MLSDTGIIVATLSSDDAYHHKANDLIQNLIPPFITTLPFYAYRINGTTPFQVMPV